MNFSIPYVPLIAIFMEHLESGDFPKVLDLRLKGDLDGFQSVYYLARLRLNYLYRNCRVNRKIRIVVIDHPSALKRRDPS